jgi:hypothetical protein
MKSKPEKPRERSGKREKLSLYGLSIEDAVRAAARTGRPVPAPQPKSRRPKRGSRKASD